MMQYLRDKWYSFSTAPSGDTLAVHPHTSDVGVLKVSSAGGQMDGAIADAILQSRAGGVFNVPVRWPLASDVQTGDAGGIVLPTGEYHTDYVDVQIGWKFMLTLSQRPSPRDSGGNEDESARYSTKVRKGQVSVIEIPSKAEIVFEGSDQSATFKPGSNVSLGPRLAADRFFVDQIQRTPKPPGVAGYGRSSLEPVLAVIDSAGQKIFEGPTRAYSDWSIPADFTPRNGRETLTVTFTWDTKELFGVVKGTKEIVVESTDAGSGK